MKKINFELFNTILENDSASVKKQVFSILESNLGIVPVASNDKELMFCECRNGKVKYFVADYKFENETVLCENIEQIEIDNSNPRQELRNMISGILKQSYTSKDKKFVKENIIGAVTSYILNDNMIKLNVAPKIYESIRNKSVNSDIKYSRALHVKINEFFNRFSKKEKDMLFQRFGNSNKPVVECKAREFKKSKKGMKKLKQFEESFVWNMKKMKKLSEKKEFAAKLKSIYDSYVKESDSFKTLVEEVSQIKGFELLTKPELAKMFHNASQLCEFVIDNEIGGKMITEMSDLVLSTKGQRMFNVINEIYDISKIDESLDMDAVVRGIRRHIYLSEAGDASPDELNAESVPTEEKTDTDKLIDKKTETSTSNELIDYTTEDAKILVDALKEMLKTIAPEVYSEKFPETEEEQVEGVPGEEDVDNIDLGIEADEQPQEQQIKESFKRFLKMINEDAEIGADEIVAVNKNDLEQEDIDSIEQVDEEENRADLILEYVEALNKMIEEDAIDVEQFESIIDFVAQYYNQMNEFNVEEPEEGESVEAAGEAEGIEQGSQSALPDVEQTVKSNTI